MQILRKHFALFSEPICFCDIQSVVKSWISQISIAYGFGNFDSFQNIACAKSELDKSIVMA